MSGPYSIRKFILFPIPPTSPHPLCYTVAMGVNGMDKTADDWRRFAQTGSIYDYLTYKNQQNTAREDVYAGGNNGPCAAAGQGGRGNRILTILTPDLGVVSASARGSLRMKSALFSATGLFCYSESARSPAGAATILWTLRRSKRCSTASPRPSRGWLWPATWRRSRRSFPPRRPRPMPSCACFSTACI